MEGPNPATSVVTQDGGASNGSRRDGAAKDGASAGPSPGATATGASSGTQPAPEQAAGQADPGPKKRGMKRSRRRALLLVVVLALLAAIGFGGAYLVYSSKYVSTDNAQVDGDKIEINAPTSGRLIDWRATQGARVSQGEILGRIRGTGGGGQPQQVIRSPGDGTVAVNPVVEGAYVTAGSNLATAYDFSKIYATARIEETEISGVRPGALVDIEVDAFANTPITGLVRDVQGSAAGAFSLFPESNSAGNFQKVTQVIPVRIEFTNTGGVRLVPGMNITVHIHKR